LIGPDRRMVERHLLGCAGCRRRLADLRDALGVLHAVAEADPPGRSEAISASLWPALSRQIRESRRSTLPWGGIEPRTAGRLGAALAACLLVGAGVWALRPDQYKVRVVKVMPTRPRPTRQFVHHIREVSVRPAAAAEAAPAAESTLASRQDDDAPARPSNSSHEPRGSDATH
jgi:hypothetical protein